LDRAFTIRPKSILLHVTLIVSLQRSSGSTHDKIIAAWTDMLLRKSSCGMNNNYNFCRWGKRSIQH